MSTPIYKVSDGSTITFKKRGPELSAILTTPNGQVINGPSRMGNTEAGAAREILLANNIIDPNSGEPLPYTVEGAQDQSSTKATNLVYEVPRMSLFETTDETALNTAKTNEAIATQDNETLNSALEAQLPPEVRLTNFINDQKVTLKKRLIPFVIGLLTPMAPQAIPLIVSNLNISGDTSLDSLQSTVQGKVDGAKDKANEIQNQADDVKSQSQDKEAMKKLATGVVAGAATSFILGKITKEVLIELVDCPSSAVIQSLTKKRNLLATQVNGMYENVKKITSLQTTVGIVVTSVTVGINLIALIPPTSLPGATVVAQTKLSKALDKAQTVVNVITLALASFGTFLGIILKFLKILDIILEHCAADQNVDFIQINDEINALANPTIAATQSENNTYKGFTLGVKIDETNQSKYIKRYAVAENKQGVPILRTDSSFASDPSILVSQLKFIIDSNPSITAE
jgi:hypothetical protein